MGYNIEERREQIYHNYKKSLEELREDKLKFASDTDKLKRMLNE